jgi:predicted RNA-binding protein YlxR (DUF448 family)
MAQKKQGPRPKHVPQRTCIACRQTAGKRSLLRIVRTDQGIEVDSTGKKPGRGAYLHPYRACWRVVLRGDRLGQALRTQLSDSDRQVLQAFMATLPESEEEETAAAGEAAGGTT